MDAMPAAIIVAGGELTIEMLDLRYDQASKFYEAPLTSRPTAAVLIDDFGRQVVSPTALLNRWIIPLENRIDFLKFHTGKSVEVRSSNCSSSPRTLTRLI